MTRRLAHPYPRGAALGLALAVPLLGLSAGPSTAAPAEADAQPRIETVLDISGSMAEADAGGQTRLAAAKAAVGRLLDGSPDGTAMGLRVYGAQYAGTSTAQGCKDTQLLSPVQPVNAATRAAAKAQVAKLKAVGMTPIGHSLRAAAADLGDAGPRRIILVSDGEDTCAPPSPCEVARELKGAGIDLTVDVVGFRVGAGTKKNLECIAKATKGTYVDAGDADELADQLGASMKRALTPYQRSGTKIRGGKDCPSAPALVPGQYLDEFGYGQARWYKVALRPGQSLRFSGSVIPGGEWETPTSVNTELSLPGQPGLWATETSVEDRWSNAMSSGIQSKRLKWDEVPAGSAGTRVCAKILNSVKTAGTEPVEVAVSIADTAVKPDGTPDTSVSGPSAEDGQPTAAPAAPRSSAAPSRAQTASATSPRRSPYALVLAALAGVALVVVTRTVARRRKGL